MREGGFRNIGGLAQRLTSTIAGKRPKGSTGVSIARLQADWAAIVGEALARRTRPEALVAGRGARGKETGAKVAAGGSGGRVLRLRVSGAAALEVQHMSGQLVERVNAFVGHRLIDDIRLVQGTIVPAPLRPALPKATPEAEQRIAGKVADNVKDPELRQALSRLGTRIAASRRAVLLAGFAAALVFGERPRAQDVSLDRLLAVLPGDHVLGSPAAPNVIIDYFSFTCPHCANFHVAVLPLLRAEWIDTGRAKLVMRHYPSDQVATHAAQLSEGVGAMRFFAAADALFRSQVDWLTAADPDAELTKSLIGLGISPRQAAAFMANDQLLDKIVGDIQSGQALKVRGTPALFINEQFYGNPSGGAFGISSILQQVAR